MSYKVLYTISFEHSYFTSGKCPAVELGLTADSADLFRRRALQLRKANTSTWEVLYDSDSAGVGSQRDILEFKLNIVDANFSLYTEWEGYNPNVVYSVELPTSGERVEACEVFKDNGLRRSIGTPFCAISLRPTEEIVLAAHSDEPRQTTIYFETQRKVWEYIFIPHDKSRLPADMSRLSIEVEGSDSISFTPFEEVEVYGKRAFRTISQQEIQVSDNYNFRLNLVVVHPEQNRSHQMLLRGIAPPALSGFHSPEPQKMRQICYL